MPSSLTFWLYSQPFINLCFPFILLPFCVDDAYPMFLGICKLLCADFPPLVSYIPPTFLGICKRVQRAKSCFAIYLLRFWVYANKGTIIEPQSQAIYPLRFWVYANRLSLYCPDYSIVRGFSECPQASLFGCIVSRLLIYLCFLVGLRLFDYLRFW